MKNKSSSTLRQAFSRVAAAGLRRFLQKFPGATLVAGRAGVLSLLLGASLTISHATIDDPNDIVGTIKWTNPNGPVRAFLLDSLNRPGVPGGLYYYFMDATPILPVVGFNASSGQTFTADPITVPYGLRVQGRDVNDTPGVPYRVTLRAATSDGNSYNFLTKDSPTVMPAFTGVGNPPNPPVTLDFCECAGLIHVLYRDTGGNPVNVDSSGVYAEIALTHEQQARGINSGQSGYWLPVRGGNDFILTVTVSAPGAQCGTDPFVDYFAMPGTGQSTEYAIHVDCDEIKEVTCLVELPPTPPCPGSGTNTPSKIIGRVDMLDENENWIDRVSTLMGAIRGPFGNYRYDSVEPGASCLAVSPYVGQANPCNSAGEFSLMNLLPSNTSTPSADYTVFGTMNFGTGRRYQYFETAHIQVPVPPSTTVDLGDTFVMNPGYRTGDVFLCGPEEQPGIPNSPLRYIIRDSDTDHVNPNGIPSSLSLAYSYVRAFGDSGEAKAIFEGEFKDAVPDKNHFVGDYRLTLGALLSQPAVWANAVLYLQFLNESTPGTPESYFRCGAEIGNYHYDHEIVIPGDSVRNDHRYGFSCVTINFHAKDGTLYYPNASATGRFDTAANGMLNFEGQPANYYAYVSGTGTPVDFASRTVDGSLNLAVPEGQYTFDPGVAAVNSDGTIQSYNRLPPFSLLVQPCQKIVICPELQMTLSSLPMCANSRTQHVTGSLNSVADVTGISYVLNGGAPVSVPISASFAFDILLADCINTLTVTATTADTNCFASVQTTSSYDRTAPVLSGCQNISTNSLAETNGNFVSYPLPTALDNCDGPLPVNCVPLPGSFFPGGATVVTCTVVDHCHNTNTCAFTVTVAGCVTITDESFGCAGTNGVNSYRFCVRNDADHALGYLTLVDLPAGLSASPYFIPLLPPLPPGQSRCVTVALSGTGTQTNLCFRLLAHSENFAQCCIISHCVPIRLTPPAITYCPPVVVACLGTNGCGVMPDATGEVLVADPNGAVVVTQSIPAGQTICSNTLVTFTVTSPCGGVTQCVAPVVIEPCCIKPPTNMVLWLTFDEPVGVTCLNSMGGNTGRRLEAGMDATPTTGPTRQTGQYVNNSLSFDGTNDAVRVTHNDNLNLGAKDFSIDAWVKWDGGLGNRFIVDKRFSSAARTGFSFFLSDGRPSLQLGTVGTPGNYTLPTAITPDEWTHLAVTVTRQSSTGIRFYINGVLAGPAFDPTAHVLNLNNTQPLWIGHSPVATTATWFGGCLDEIEIFSRALRADEVLGLYDAGAKGKCRPFFCTVPAVVSACSNSVTVSATICNAGALGQTFGVSFRGLSAIDCGLPNAVDWPAIPNPFAPSSTMVYVGPNACVTLPITITRPPALTGSMLGTQKKACYDMVIRAVGSGERFGCRGLLVDGGWNCPVPVGGNLTNLSQTTNIIAKGTNPVVVSFTLTNPTNATVVLTPVFTVMDGLMMTETNVVSLNGLPPGLSVTNQVTLPPNGSATVMVSVSFLEPYPNSPYQVVLLLNIGGNGALEPVASATVLNVIPRTEGVVLYLNFSGGQPVVSWDAVNSPFLLESILDLSGTNWTPVLDPVVPLPDGSLGVILQGTNGSRFFRGSNW